MERIKQKVLGHALSHPKTKESRLIVVLYLRIIIFSSDTNLAKKKSH